MPPVPFRVPSRWCIIVSPFLPPFSASLQPIKVYFDSPRPKMDEDSESSPQVPENSGSLCIPFSFPTAISSFQGSINTARRIIYRDFLNDNIHYR